MITPPFAITPEDDISDADLALLPIVDRIVFEATRHPQEPMQRVLLRGLRAARALPMPRRKRGACDHAGKPVEPLAAGAGQR